MEKQENFPERAELRRLAEAALEASSHEEDDLSGISLEEMKNLIHELGVHQIELKMQNEELLRVQGELEKARDRYSHLYDFAPVGYFTVSEKGIITEANLTAATLLGIERTFLIGSPFSRFILREDQDIFYLHRKQLMDAKKPQPCRLRMAKKDETVFYANLECMVIEGGDGHPLQIRAAVSDITEQKDLENHLRQAQKMEAVGRLAGGIAHDFNNILAAMIGFTELALDEVEKGTPLADNLEEALIGGQRAKLLVQQILTFSRKAPGKVEPLWLDALVRDAVRLLRATISADIEIGIEMGSEETPCVMGDEMQIHQIIMNLCTNAAHAMETEGGKLTIGVHAVTLGDGKSVNLPNFPPGKYVTLSVGDTGFGISPENIERIFEPYFSTKEPGRGTGMGLAIVAGIVKAQKGHIVVMSQPKRGSTFTVFLPLLERAECESDGAGHEVLTGGTEHIFFIDDELPIMKLNKVILEKLGYQVTTSASSVEALELFRMAPGTFDLVVTDITMPIMTGDKLAAELLKIRPDIPVIICTGYSNKMSKELAAEMGIKAFAYKPLDKAELAKTVRKVLDEIKGSTEE